jgi:hypothetical protein
MFPHYITCGPPQRRREEVLPEILLTPPTAGGYIININFLLELLKVATMNE